MDRSLQDQESPGFLLFPIVAAAVSCIGCLLNILLTVVLQGLSKTSIGKMVIFITLMDLCISITYIVDCFLTRFRYPMYSYDLPKIICFCANFGTMGIAACFGDVVLKIANGESSIVNFHKKYIWLSAMMCLLSVPIMVWIKLSTDEMQYFIVAGSFLPVFAISFIICFYKYYQAIRVLSDQSGKIFYEFIIYPTIFVFCEIGCAIVMFGAYYFYANPYDHLLFIIVSTLWQLQGFLNSIVFGLYRQALRICSRKNQENIGIQAITLPTFRYSVLIQSQSPTDEATHEHQIQDGVVND